MGGGLGFCPRRVVGLYSGQAEGGGMESADGMDGPVACGFAGDGGSLADNGETRDRRSAATTWRRAELPRHGQTSGSLASSRRTLAAAPPPFRRTVL